MGMVHNIMSVVFTVGLLPGTLSVSTLPLNLNALQAEYGGAQRS